MENTDDTNRQTVINWVSRLVLDLVTNPELVSIQTKVDEKGLLIQIYAPKSELGRLIGKQGRTANAIRELAYNYGSRHGARISIKISPVEGDDADADRTTATEVSTIE